MKARRPLRSRAVLRAGCAGLVIAGGVALLACGSEPKVPVQAALAPAAAASAAASAATGKVEEAVARKVTVTGPRGRLGQAERENLLRKLSAQGSATLLQRHLAAMAVFGDLDLLSGNEAQLLIDGPAAFEAMFKAIESARRHVLVESYIVEDASVAQRLAEALKRKRAQGVQVAMIYDAVGSMGTDAAYFDGLRQAGIQVCAFNPLTSARQRKSEALSERDHRKILAIDGHTAFTGGINISSVYASGSFRRRAASATAEEGWRDTHLQLRGPAATRLDALVRQTWQDQGCEGSAALAGAQVPVAAASSSGRHVVRVVPTEPGDDHSRLYAQLMTAFDTAQRSIHVTMAYFAPGDEMVDALSEAARRGVDVQLVLPSRSDFKPVLHAGRARYEQLLQAGVRIHEFQSAVLHAKTAVIDGVWSTVGSSNLDYRSFVGNNEINVIVLGEDFGDAMQRMFRQDVAASVPITREAWQQRPLSQRLLEKAAQLFERWW